MLRKNDTLIVSYYKNKRSRYNANITIEEALVNDEYKNVIDKIRNCEYHSAEYDMLKEDLPIFTPSSTFKYGLSKTAENAIPNKMICIDIDYQDNKEFIDEVGLEELKYNIINISSVISVSLSCGGRGIMVMHRLSDSVTKETFKDYFNELKILYKNAGIIIDNECSNINRLRYISYDADIIYNEIYEPYELQGIIENDNNEIKQNIDKSKISYHNWKVNPDFNINNYHIASDEDIEGFNAIRRKWLATTIKRFFGDRGLQLAIDIYKAYPNSVVKEDSINEIRRDYTYKPACITSIANDLVKLGILIPNEEELKTKHNIITLKDDQYLSDVINDLDFQIGFNLLIAGTGYGKTEVWKNLTNKTDVIGLSTTNVLVCEPRNSIIVSKYIDDQYEQIYGNKQFPTTPNGLVVTNYDKLIRNRMTQNPDWFNKFEYFIIDESHLLFSEAYRDNSIIKFIELLTNIKDNIKIIFQTATPTDEDSMFNIPKENIFVVNKPSDKNTSIEYVDCYGDLLYNAAMISKKAIENKEYDKVFIYNGVGSVTLDEAVKKNLKDKFDIDVLVYHRKSRYKREMEMFDEQHTLNIIDDFKNNKYDIFLSSTAASVGIDINDDVKVLVLIIGNITFEEEMQVAGRFRKCKDMTIKCLIGNNNYEYNNWMNKRKKIFIELDNIQKNNCDTDSMIKNRSTYYNIPVGNVKDHLTKKLKYFQIKNLLLRKSFDYKIKKYMKYGWKFNERIINTNMFDILKYVDGFELGKTEFKIKDNKDKKYKDIIVDNKDIYRLYGNNKEGFVICRKYYTDDDMKIARQYRKDISDKSNEIKEKLLNIIKNDQWSDNMYSFKNDFPNIENWIDNTVTCYKYYKPLFNILDDETIMNNTKLIYILMKTIEYSNKDNYDWIEWFVIKLCRENKVEGLNMCGYAYLLWCLYSTNSNINKLVKFNYFDKFKQLYNLLVYEIDDDIYEVLCTQIECNYNKSFDLNNIEDNIFDINNKEELDNKIDVLIEKVHKSKYYSMYDINNLVKHMEEDMSKDIIDSYDKLYLTYVRSEGDKSGNIKKIVVVSKMPDKYNLNIGDTFNSCKELAEYCNININTVSRWLRGGDIKEQ